MHMLKIMNSLPFQYNINYSYNSDPVCSLNIVSGTEYSYKLIAGTERGRLLDTHLHAARSPSLSFVDRELT